MSSIKHYMIVEHSLYKRCYNISGDTPTEKTIPSNSVKRLLKMIAVRTGRHIQAASMLTVVILVDDDEVGNADEMSMMYESDASCISYTACYITTLCIEQIPTFV
jgi:hypothetical protein